LALLTFALVDGISINDRGRFLPLDLERFETWLQ
jgi:hypothetical protein